MFRSSVKWSLFHNLARPLFGIGAKDKETFTLLEQKMASNNVGEFVLVDYDDGCSKEIAVSFVKKPRRDFKDYKIGERVEARYPGLSGVYGGTIAALSDDREWLKSVKSGPRPVITCSKPYLSRPESDDRNREQPQAEMENQPNDKGMDMSGTQDMGLKRKQLEWTDDVADADQSEFTEKKKQRTKPVEKSKKTSFNEEQEAKTLKTRCEELDVPVDKETEAKKAKQEAAKIKKLKSQAMQKTSTEMSLSILEDAEATGSQLNIEQLLQDMQEVKRNQQKLTSLIEPLLTVFQCKECLRNMYKGAKSTSQATTRLLSPLRPVPSITPMTPPSAPLVCRQEEQIAPSQQKPMIRKLGIELNTQEMGQTAADTDNQEDQKEGPAAEMPVSGQPDEPTNSDLAYIGESRYGVQMNSMQLRRCIDTSNSAEKLALNLLEFLLSKEDCANMTVYGYGKKKSMDPNMRRSIKSQIFSLYRKEKSEEENIKFWNETVVYKLNDKIRGIRNGKYQTKKD